MASSNSKGTFPIAKFVGTSIHFKEGTRFDDVQILKGLYKVSDGLDNSTYYTITIEHAGSSNDTVEKYNKGKAIPIGPGNQLTVDD